MKNFVYIVSLMLFVFLTACQKEDFREELNVPESPEWIGSEDLRGVPASAARTTEEGDEDDNDDDDTSDPNGITDPNSDPDGDRKGKGSR